MAPQSTPRVTLAGGSPSTCPLTHWCGSFGFHAWRFSSLQVVSARSPVPSGCQEDDPGCDLAAGMCLISHSRGSTREPQLGFGCSVAQWEPARSHLLQPGCRSRQGWPSSLEAIQQWPSALQGRIRRRPRRLTGSRSLQPGQCDALARRLDQGPHVLDPCR